MKVVEINWFIIGDATQLPYSPSSSARVAAFRARDAQWRRGANSVAVAPP